MLTLAARLVIAALIGLAAGLEREWSGHASGPNARFAGLRTFFVLGMLGGIAGLFADASYTAIAAILAAGGVALCVGAYVMTVRRPGAETDGTTEAAALAVIALGAVSGVGWMGLAAGAGAILVLMLREKKRLHWMVQRLEEPELRAGLQFAALAVVVLPLLPVGPYFGALAVKPRALWAIVLLFSGLSFAAFVARRIVGASRGLGIAGALGGVVSSTAVALSFSRQSQTDTGDALALARGVIAASTVLVPRVLVLSAVLNPAVSLALLPILAPMFVAGVLYVVFGWRNVDTATGPRIERVQNPLELGAAIRMAIAFQAAMVLITFVRQYWGSPGLYASGVALGFTDVDALTASMSRKEANLEAGIAAHVIAVGILSNTVLKTSITAIFGRAAFRWRAIAGFAALAAGGVLGFMLA